MRVDVEIRHPREQANDPFIVARSTDSGSIEQVDRMRGLLDTAWQSSERD